MFTRITSGTGYALCLLAPWSLLWLDSNLLFPYTTGKTWVFRSIVELAFAFSLVTLVQQRIFANRERKKLTHGVSLLLLISAIFLTWSGLTNLTGVDFYRSFWSNWERMGGYLDYLHWGMYLVCLVTAASSASRSRVLLINLFAVLTLVCLFGSLDGETRSISTLGNPIYLGNLAVFGLFLGLFLLSHSYKTAVHTWLYKSLILVAMLTIAMALYGTAARGPLFALTIGLLLVAIYTAQEYLPRFSRVSAREIVIFLLGLMLVIFTQIETIQQLMRDSESYTLQRLGSISTRDQTTADRLENWSIAFDAARQHPWLGWGQENYMIAFNEHYNSGHIDNAQLWFDRAHNAYLDVLVASGPPGLLLYLGMLGLPLWLVLRSPRMNRFEKAAMLALFSAFLAKNLVGFDTFSSSLIWLTCAAYVMSTHREKPVSSIHQVQHGRYLGPAVLLIASMSLALYSIYALNIRPYQDNRRFSTLMNRPLAQASQALNVIVSTPVDALRYAKTERLAVFDKVIRERRIPNTQGGAEQVARKAVKLINSALMLQPRDYRIKYNGALLLAHLGDYDRAMLLLEELTQTIPQRPAFWHTLATIYTTKGLNEAATQAKQTAANLNPEWKP